MLVPVGLLAQPPAGRGPEVLEVVEFSGVEQVFFDVDERLLYLSLRFRASRFAHDGLAVIMGDEGDEGRIEDGLARLPAKHHRLLPVVEALTRHALEVTEGVTVPADEGMEVPAEGEIDVVPAREPENVGEAEHRGSSPLGEVDRVGAPIHLALGHRDPSRIAPPVPVWVEDEGFSTDLSQW